LNRKFFMTHAFAFSRLLAISAAALALVGGPAMADSQYGYTAVVGAQVTATARVNLSIVVPKLILLRVGSTTAGGDTLLWTAGFDIPPAPTAASNQNYAWSGAAPVPPSITRCPQRWRPPARPSPISTPTRCPIPIGPTRSQARRPRGWQAPIPRP
jgi:hypothetical protein